MSDESTDQQPKGPGRPKGEPGIRLSLWLKEREFDEAARRAHRNGESLSALGARALRQYLKKR